MRTRSTNLDTRPPAPGPALALAALALALCACLAACQAGTAVPAGAGREEPAAGLSTAAAPAPTGAADAGSPAGAAGGMTLTLWTTLAFSPTQAITAGQVLAGEFASFEAAHPGVRLRVVLKEPYGAGGLLDSLVKTGPVVPGLLPDLIVLDVNELPAGAGAGYLQPLDGLLPSGLVADLYPFARQAGVVDGRLYGLQFEADLDHLVYNSGAMSLPPRSWPGALSIAGSYLFPAGGVAGLANDALLAQVLAVRDQTGVAADQPFPDAASLATVLQFYDDAVSRGIVPGRVAGYHSTDDYWNDYLGGQAAMAQVSAHRYLLDRARLSGSGVAAVPGMHGPAAPISRGWALALVTADPDRQAAAVELLEQLMRPAANAAWNRAAAMLPTRAAALPGWQPDAAYGSFISGQLQTARARPDLPNYTQVAARLQEAVAAVLSGSATPDQAAAGAGAPPED